MRPKPGSFSISARASAPTGFDIGLQEKTIFWWAFIGQVRGWRRFAYVR